jgi:beta-glucosidase-like glycosyl hydrolase
MNCIVLGARCCFQIFWIVALQTFHKCGSYAGSKKRIFSISFLSASPSWITKDIDVSLKRLFTIRFRLGLFDPVSMVKYAKIPITNLESQPHKDLALKMARESIVLLRNKPYGDEKNNVLPLSKNIGRIAVLGPNADNANTQLGNYNGHDNQGQNYIPFIPACTARSSVFRNRGCKS